MSDEQRALVEFMPAMTVQEAGARRASIVKFVQEIMVEGTDFGVIPGTQKPTLLKPGAEKLTTLFGLSSRFVLIDKIEDWDGAQHGGEPLFNYAYKCQLWHGALQISEGDGSCNSREKKYRFRQGERKCPQCGKPTIIKGKEEYGGGWLCFGKKGGCGYKFAANDPLIVSQEVGQVANPDIADQVNTLMKMAQKRAFIAATLLAVNASEFFTQDMEDIITEGEYIPVGHQPEQKQEPQKKPDKPAVKNWPPALITWGCKEFEGVNSFGIIGALNKSTVLKMDSPLDVQKHWLEIYRKERETGVDSDEATKRADADLQATQESK